MMDTGTTKSANKAAASSMIDNSAGLREMAVKATAQAKEGCEKLSSATTEATGLLEDSYSTAIKGVQDYNGKLIEFVRANVSVNFDFTQKMSGVKSPSEFTELSTEYARKQFETLTEQTKELAALAQKVAVATMAPLKKGATKAFAHSS